MLAKGVPGGNAKVTVTPLVVMLPVTGLVALSLSVKVVAVTVAGLTGSLNVTVRAEDVDTFVAPLAGVVALIARVVAPVLLDPGDFPSQERRFEPRKMTNTE